MIAILLARRGIKAGRLNMAIGLHADPDIGIGGRHPQLPDPRQLDAVLQMAFVGEEILKAPPPFDPRDAGFVVAGVDQARDAEFGSVLYCADHEFSPVGAWGSPAFIGRWIIPEKPRPG